MYRLFVVAWAALAWFGRTLGRVGVREVPPLLVRGLFRWFPLPKVIHAEHCLDATDLGRRQKGRPWVQAGANQHQHLQENESAHRRQPFSIRQESECGPNKETIALTHCTRLLSIESPCTLTYLLRLCATLYLATCYTSRYLILVVCKLLLDMMYHN